MRTSAQALTAEIVDELNVRELELIGDEAEMVERSLYPLLPVVGPRHGKAVGAIMAGARSGEWRLRDDGTVEVGEVVLQPDEFELTARAKTGHEVAEEGDLLVALDTTVDDELEAEGLAREVAHRLQALRREAGFEISDRIRFAIGLPAGGGGAAGSAPRVARGRSCSRPRDRSASRPSCRTQRRAQRSSSTARRWSWRSPAPEHRVR